MAGATKIIFQATITVPENERDLGRDELWEFLSNMFIDGDESGFEASLSYEEGDAADIPSWIETPSFSAGDAVMLTEDALETYGHGLGGVAFMVTYVARRDDQPVYGIDSGSDALEVTGEEIYGA